MPVALNIRNVAENRNTRIYTNEKRIHANKYYRVKGRFFLGVSIDTPILCKNVKVMAEWRRRDKKVGEDVPIVEVL